MSLSMDVEELEKGRVDCQFEGESSLRQCRRYIETKSKQENILENSVKQALGEQHNVTNSLEELKGAMAEQKGAMAELRGPMVEQQGATAELRRKRCYENVRVLAAAASEGEIRFFFDRLLLCLDH